MNTGVKNDTRVHGPCLQFYTGVESDARVQGPWRRPVNTGVKKWSPCPWGPVDTGVILDTRVHGPWTRPVNTCMVLVVCTGHNSDRVIDGEAFYVIGFLSRIHGSYPR